MNDAVLAYSGIVLTAFLGLLEWVRRNHVARQAVLSAFAADAYGLCVLAEHLGFRHTYERWSQLPLDEAGFPTFAIASDYAGLHAQLADRLTLLKPHEVATIGMFYRRAKVAIDTARSESGYGRATGSKAVRMCRFMCYQLDEMIRLASQIRRFPMQSSLLGD